MTSIFSTAPKEDKALEEQNAPVVEAVAAEIVPQSEEVKTGEVVNEVQPIKAPEPVSVPAPDVVLADLTKKGDERPKRQPRKDGEKETAENEIMVAAKGKINRYLGYALSKLHDKKTDHRELKIKATGNAIVKALILVELIKKKVGENHNYDLYQSNKIYSMEIVSIEKSKIEGMDAIESRRRVAAMDTILSKDPLDETEPGYQFCKAEPKEPGAEVIREEKKKERK